MSETLLTHLEDGVLQITLNLPKTKNAFTQIQWTRFSDALKEAQENKAVLTISEHRGFIAKGGMIEIGGINNRLIFSINRGAAKKQGLNIGFQLLSLARSVIEI